MMHIKVTRHAEARMSQRGIRWSDIEVLLEHGTETGPDRIMLTNRDAARLISGLKKQIAMVERVVGKEAVVANGVLVTAYHRTRPDRRIDHS